MESTTRKNGEPLSPGARIAGYQRQNGTDRLTPRQRRRVDQKLRREIGHPAVKEKRRLALEPSGECKVFRNGDERETVPHRWAFKGRLLRKPARRCAVCGETEVVD